MRRLQTGGWTIPMDAFLICLPSFQGIPPGSQTSSSCLVSPLKGFVPAAGAAAFRLLLKHLILMAQDAVKLVMDPGTCFAAFLASQRVCFPGCVWGAASCGIEALKNNVCWG